MKRLMWSACNIFVSKTGLMTDIVEDSSFRVSVFVRRYVLIRYHSLYASVADDDCNDANYFKDHLKKRLCFICMDQHYAYE